LGEPVALRWGRYLFLNPHHLEWTKGFFHRHGGKTVFFSRFLPVVRHLISIPAGLAGMSLAPFILFTAVGATLWNGFLAYLGLRLKENWRLIEQYAKILDFLMLAGMLGLAAYFVWKFRASRKAV
jgi:membrane protein DedA with SNARE-associated domain